MLYLSKLILLFLCRNGKPTKFSDAVPMCHLNTGLSLVPEIALAQVTNNNKIESPPSLPLKLFYLSGIFELDIESEQQTT